MLFPPHLTDFGQNDDSMTTFEDCAKQRNLTDKGRDEARATERPSANSGYPSTVLASLLPDEKPRCSRSQSGKTLDLRGWPTSAQTPTVTLRCGGSPHRRFRDEHGTRRSRQPVRAVGPAASNGGEAAKTARR